MIVSEVDGLIWNCYQVGINALGKLTTRDIIGEEADTIEIDVKLTRIMIGATNPVGRWMVMAGDDKHLLTVHDIKQLYQLYGPDELLIMAEEIEGVTK